MTPTDLRRAIALCKAAGNRTVPIPIEIARRIAIHDTGNPMPTKSIGKPKLSTKPDGRTKIEPARKRTSVSRAIGAEKKAARTVKAIERSAPGRVTVSRARR